MKLGCSREAMQQSVTSYYLLIYPLSAVRLKDYINADNDLSSMGFCMLAAGHTVAVRGRSTLSGMIDITCDGHDYAIFKADLEARGKLLLARSDAR